MIDAPANDLFDGLFNLGSWKSMQVIEMVKLIQARCLSKFSYSPVISVPDITNDITLPELIFDISKISATGFKVLGDFNKEIDNLLDMCAEL